MRWFDASPRRATPKGHDLHHLHSTTSGSPTYIRLPSALVAHSRSSRRSPGACAPSPAPRTSPRCAPTYRPRPSTAAAPSTSSPNSPAETSGSRQQPVTNHPTPNHPTPNHPTPNHPTRTHPTRDATVTAPCHHLLSALHIPSGGGIRL